MKKIIVFQMEEPVKVKQAVATMKLRVESISPTYFHNTVESLVEGNELTEQENEKDLPKGSLLLMCGLNRREIDEVLLRLYKSHLSITYKAVLTETNRKWDIYHLYEEMEKESLLYAKQGNKGEMT